MRPASTHITAALLAALAMGCTWFDRPPDPGDVVLPAPAGQQARWLAEHDTQLQALVVEAAAPTQDATECERQLPGLVRASAQLREELAGLDDPRVEGLIVNLTAALWDHQRSCIEGAPDPELLQELAVYAESLSEWSR